MMITTNRTTGQWGCEGTMLMQTSCLKNKNKNNLWWQLRRCFWEKQQCAAEEGVLEGGVAQVANFGAAELSKATVVNDD
jgi:hypothetical protein